jgi:DNA transposition AAA+ family ATPase
VTRADVDLPTKPGYFETPTSVHITNLLHMARRGRVVAAATGAGLGKSETGKNFCECYPNSWIITLRPSLCSIAQVLSAVLKKLGEPRAKGSPDMLFDRICEIVSNRHKPLLIFDELQHASTKTIDEIRSLNDETGVGVALMGNIPVLKKIEGGGRDEAFAQIYSRIGIGWCVRSRCARMRKRWPRHGASPIRRWLT